MSEQKKPEAGEFWEWGGVPVRVIGQRESGHYVCEHKCGTLRPNCTAADMKHLPDCDSFEWQPETFPQFYLPQNQDSTTFAYVRRDDESTLTLVNIDGTDGPKVLWISRDAKYRKQVTQAEAEARVKKPEPVESPDDWVTQDRVSVRVGIDEFRYCQMTFRMTHEYDNFRGYEHHGWIHPDTGDSLHLRCRRRDLPPLPEETPKREYVRCFASWGTSRLYAANGKFDPKDSELKHDGTGFYLENAT